MCRLGSGAYLLRSRQESRNNGNSPATPSDIYAWLTEISSQRLEVQEDRWQPVITLADQAAAERKLNHWLTKPTDGIFAKLNRRISVPISRQLIKWPITPNMVSILTLGVGFVSGVYFAMGGYWNTLFAALLSLWASILDGCDGEVARLKLLESDFGCWLETVCDYLYYLFIFSGMAIGLIRTVGPKFAGLGCIAFVRGSRHIPGNRTRTASACAWTARAVSGNLAGPG